MNNIRRKVLYISLLSSGLFLAFLVDPAWAVEGSREWRPIYDLVMRWVNFGILVFFLVKVVWPHLSNFLDSQKSEIQSMVERAESEKNAMLAKVREAKDSLENSGPRLEEIRSRIVDQGERQKLEIVDKAKEQSRLLMENARHRIDNQINQARHKLMNELMDVAMDKALERLPAEMTDDDSNRLIQKYLKATALANEQL